MNEVIARELEILWSDFSVNTVEQKLEAIERLKSVSTKDDLPQLITALKSEKNDFWTRELLSEPISELGGSKYLIDLFEAFQKNFDEGHDNDSFSLNLTEIAYSEPVACKEKLLKQLNSAEFKHRNHAEWLLGFCE